MASIDHSAAGRVKFLCMNLNIIDICSYHSSSYEVKIINPQKKSDFIYYHFHGCNIKFKSMTTICIKLIDELRDEVPEKDDFNVGYMY